MDDYQEHWIYDLDENIRVLRVEPRSATAAERFSSRRHVDNSSYKPPPPFENGASEKYSDGESIIYRHVPKRKESKPVHTQSPPFENGASLKDSDGESIIFRHVPKHKQTKSKEKKTIAKLPMDDTSEDERVYVHNPTTSKKAVTLKLDDASDEEIVYQFVPVKPQGPKPVGLTTYKHDSDSDVVYRHVPASKRSKSVFTPQVYESDSDHVYTHYASESKQTEQEKAKTTQDKRRPEPEVVYELIPHSSKQAEPEPAKKTPRSTKISIERIRGEAIKNTAEHPSKEAGPKSRVEKPKKDDKIVVIGSGNKQITRTIFEDFEEFEFPGYYQKHAYKPNTWYFFLK